MHQFLTAFPAYFAGEMINYTTTLLITLLLFVLTLRASKLPGTPVANILFAACGVLWSFGSLVWTAHHPVGPGAPGAIVLAARAAAFSAAAWFPIPVLAIWLDFAARPRQRIFARIVLIAASISALVFTALFWMPVFAGAIPPGYSTALAANASVFLLLGAVASLRRHTNRRGVFYPSIAMVAAICGATLATVFNSQGSNTLLDFLSSHLVLLVILSAFLLFARFRYADIFIRHSVRILLAGICGSVLASAAQSTLFEDVADAEPSKFMAHIFLLVITANVFLLSFAFVTDRLSNLINRGLFRAPDYRAVSRELAATLAPLDLPSEVTSATEQAARTALELSTAEIIPIDPANPWPADLLEGETIAHNGSATDVIIPVPTAGRVTHTLRVTPGANRPGLVMDDLLFLRAIALQCGNRLDAIERQRESAERLTRESLLVQQVTEAELRALRAQVNPHFLFNSLNTIADLTVRDPARAEAMTLRLASVFRHVLANSSRPLTTIREEMDFLRTYLHIEEARFGDRLNVAFDVEQSIAGHQLPSLILQPLVENALKHGLAPKPGRGHIWIRARALQNAIEITIEDDGMGLRSPLAPGLGLANIADRLKTLYQDRAGVTLEPREPEGARATVIIPATVPCEP